MLTFEHPLVFIDCEMTGLNPEINQLIEITAIQCDPSNLGKIRVFSRECGLDTRKGTLNRVVENVNPSALEKLPINLSQLTDRLKYKADPLTVVSNLIEWLPNHYILVGFNLYQDLRFIDDVLSGYNLKTSYLHKRSIDLLSLIELVKCTPQGRGLKGFSLSATCKHFKINKESHQLHTSQGDVELTIELFKKLITLINTDTNV